MMWSYPSSLIYDSRHRGAFCKFPFHYGSNKSTGKKTGKTHLGAVQGFECYAQIVLHLKLEKLPMQNADLIVFAIQTYWQKILKKGHSESFDPEMFSNTGGPHISWLLVTKSNHEMRGSWIPWTFFSVKPNTMSKRFQAFFHEFFFLLSVKIAFRYMLVEFFIPTCDFQPGNLYIHQMEIGNNGILLPKLFWPTLRKHYSSDREKLL